MQFKNLTEQQEEQIKEILKKYSNFFSLVTLAPELVDNEKYKTFGKYNTSNGELKLNPKVFSANDFEDERTKKRLPMLDYVLLHEVAHDIWKNLGEEGQQQWMQISGWELNPIFKEGKKNLVIPQSDGKQEVSNWYYDQQAEESFPRWYAKKTPKEDFCDSWVFIKRGLIGRFDSDIGKAKINFIEQL